MITQSTHQPTNDERLLAYRLRKHRHDVITGIKQAVDRISAAMHGTDTPDRDDNTPTSSDSRGPSPWQRGAFYLREMLALIGILVFLTIPAGSIYALGQADYSEPECKSMYTRSGAMRMHCEDGWLRHE